MVNSGDERQTFIRLSIQEQRVLSSPSILREDHTNMDSEYITDSAQ